MKVTEVRIALVNEGLLRAFATVTVDNCLAIRDVRIIEGPERLFIAMPSKKLQSGRYRDLVHPINAEVRRIIEDAVIAEYLKAAAKNS